MKSLCVVVFAFSVFGLARHAGAGEIQAYAGGVAGPVSAGPGVNCGTSGPDPAISGPWSALLTLPIGGISGCGLSGGVDDRSASSGTLTASQSVTGAATGGGVFTGSAQARAGFWSLGVAVDGSNSGGSATLVYRQTAAFARFLTPITLNSPGLATGTPGSVNFSFLIDGTMSSLRNAPFSQQVDTYLQLRINGALNPWTSFASTIIDDALPFVRGGSTGLPGAFVRGAGSLSGSADVASTGNFGFLWGVPFTVEVALSAQQSTCCFGTSLATDFLNTAQLSGIQAFGSGGRVTDFSGVDDAGNLLGPTGITGVVPEPSAALLMAAGLLGLAWRRAAHRTVGEGANRRYRPGP